MLLSNSTLQKFYNHSKHDKEITVFKKERILTSLKHMYDLRPYIKFKDQDIYRKDYNTCCTESVQRIESWLKIFTAVIKNSIKELKQKTRN